MQPDKTKCCPQIPITTLWPAASKMLSTSSGSPPPNSETLSLRMERNCRIWRGAAGYWNVTLATTRQQACLDVLSPIFDVGKGKMWWLIEICINCVVHRPFDGYHELSGDLKLCRCQMIAGYFWIQCQYDNSKGRTYFHPCKHAWLPMKIYGPKLEPRSKFGHENCRALEPENSAESEHYLLDTRPLSELMLTHHHGSENEDQIVMEFWIQNNVFEVWILYVQLVTSVFPIACCPGQQKLPVSQANFSRDCNFLRNCIWSVFKNAKFWKLDKRKKKNQKKSDMSYWSDFYWIRIFDQNLFCYNVVKLID